MQNSSKYTLYLFLVFITSLFSTTTDPWKGDAYANNSQSLQAKDIFYENV